MNEGKVEVGKLSALFSSYKNKFSLITGEVAAKLPHTSKVVHSVAANPKKPHLITAAGQMLFLWVPKNDEIVVE